MNILKKKYNIGDNRNDNVVSLAATSQGLWFTQCLYMME